MTNCHLKQSEEQEILTDTSDSSGYQMHAPQLYSLALTQFCLNLESSTTNVRNAKNDILSRASHVTFGPWITFRSCKAAAPTNPNCQESIKSSSTETFHLVSTPRDEYQWPCDSPSKKNLTGAKKFTLQKQCRLSRPIGLFRKYRLV